MRKGVDDSGKAPAGWGKAPTGNRLRHCRGLSPPGNTQFVGTRPTDGYKFDRSRGMYDGRFIGRRLNGGNGSELTGEPIYDWPPQVLKEAGIPDLSYTGEMAAVSWFEVIAQRDLEES